MHNVRVTAACKTPSHTQSTVFYWLNEVNRSIEKCLNMISSNFSILTHLYFFLAYHNLFLPKKWFFLPFSQKTKTKTKQNKTKTKAKQSILSKIWYQKWILRLISITEMCIFIYITVTGIIRQLQHATFFTTSGLTPPLSLVLAGPPYPVFPHGTTSKQINNPCTSKQTKAYQFSKLMKRSPRQIWRF